ncbi:MAG: glycosyltransferase, partial [Candidatus Binatia bacterium]
EVRLVTAGDFATVRDLIQVADLALCPRREWSGFPMKLLNYMAAAKAVVVSAGSAKAVRDGRNGVVVGADGAEAYAAAIIGLLADPARRRVLGAAARRTVENEYGWERVIDQVESTYQTVLARRAAAIAAPNAQPFGILEA